jgi:hypothetical protein
MKNGKSIRGALSYNETKVRAGTAELILASRYGCDASELSFSQKLKRFAVLNDNCVTSSFNTVHISLNFSASDSIDPEKLQLIARDYMQALGFEKQPYLVYRHHDTAHPHLHIVTTPVKPTGRTINLHNLVQRKSEPARKYIEEAYQLTKAEGRRQSEGLAPIEISSVVFGKAETKHAIAQVVRSVMENWRFTSLEEYNLILRQFGVCADLGQPGTRMHKNGGLQYFITNTKGEKLSVRIKASSIYTSPTLKNIERKIARNSIKNQASRQYTASDVQFALSGAKSKNEIAERLLVKQIHLVRTEGNLMVLDFRNRTVNSLTDLGFSSNSMEKLDILPSHERQTNFTILQKLMEPEFTGPELASAFLKKKRKKKK